MNKKTKALLIGLILVPYVGLAYLYSELKNQEQDIETLVESSWSKDEQIEALQEKVDEIDLLLTDTSATAEDAATAVAALQEKVEELESAVEILQLRVGY